MNTLKNFIATTFGPTSNLIEQLKKTLDDQEFDYKNPVHAGFITSIGFGESVNYDFYQSIYDGNSATTLTEGFNFCELFGGRAENVEVVNCGSQLVAASDEDPMNMTYGDYSAICCFKETEEGALDRYNIQIQNNENYFSFYLSKVITQEDTAGYDYHHLII